MQDVEKRDCGGQWHGAHRLPKRDIIASAAAQLQLPPRFVGCHYPHHRASCTLLSFPPETEPSFFDIDYLACLSAHDIAEIRYVTRSRHTAPLLFSTTTRPIHLRNVLWNLSSCPSYHVVSHGKRQRCTAARARTSVQRCGARRVVGTGKAVQVPARS